MAYIHVSSTRDIARSVNYAFDEKEENNESNPRVLTSSGINISGEKGIDEMKAVLSRHGKADGDYVQGQHIIQSFSKSELSKDSYEDVEKANKIGREFANEQFGDERQVVIVTQADGDGGMLHNHIVVNNVSFIDGRSLRGNQKDWSYLTRESDKVLKMNDLEPLEPVKNKTGWDKVSKTEIDLREKGEYVWKDDLKQRIDNGMNADGVKSESDFSEYMSENESVDVEYHDFVDEKGRNVSGMSYKFKAENNQSKTVKAKALGSKFMRENVNNELEKNNVKSRHESLDNFADSIDFDAQIRSMRPNEPKRKRTVKREVEVKEVVEPTFEELEQQRLEQLELEEERERIEKERYEQEQARERREKERIEQEQERVRLQRIEDEKKEAENKRIIEQQEAELERQRRIEVGRERIRQRIQSVQIVKVDVSEREIDSFAKTASELSKTGVAKARGRTMNYTDRDVLRVSRIRMSEEDKAIDQNKEITQEHNELEL